MVAGVAATGALGCVVSARDGSGLRSPNRSLGTSPARNSTPGSLAQRPRSRLDLTRSMTGRNLRRSTLSGRHAAARAFGRAGRPPVTLSDASCRLLPFRVSERADLRGVGRRERYGALAVSERANLDGRPTRSHVACRCNRLCLWTERRDRHGVPRFCVCACECVWMQVAELVCGAIGASPDSPSVSGGGSPMAWPTARPRGRWSTDGARYAVGAAVRGASAGTPVPVRNPGVTRRARRALVAELSRSAWAGGWWLYSSELLDHRACPVVERRCDWRARVGSS